MLHALVHHHYSSKPSPPMQHSAPPWHSSLARAPNHHSLPPLHTKYTPYAREVAQGHHDGGPHPPWLQTQIETSKHAILPPPLISCGLPAAYSPFSYPGHCGRHQLDKRSNIRFPRYFRGRCRTTCQNLVKLMWRPLPNGGRLFTWFRTLSTRYVKPETSPSASTLDCSNTISPSSWCPDCWPRQRGKQVQAAGSRRCRRGSGLGGGGEQGISRRVRSVAVRSRQEFRWDPASSGIAGELKYWGLGTGCAGVCKALDFGH